MCFSRAKKIISTQATPSGNDDPQEMQAGSSSTNEPCEVIPGPSGIYPEFQDADSSASDTSAGKLVDEPSSHEIALLKDEIERLKNIVQIKDESIVALEKQLKSLEETLEKTLKEHERQLLILQSEMDCKTKENESSKNSPKGFTLSLIL